MRTVSEGVRVILLWCHTGAAGSLRAPPPIAAAAASPPPPPHQKQILVRTSDTAVHLKSIVQTCKHHSGYSQVGAALHQQLHHRRRQLADETSSGVLPKLSALSRLAPRSSSRATASSNKRRT